MRSPITIAASPISRSTTTTRRCATSARRSSSTRRTRSPGTIAASSTRRMDEPDRAVADFDQSIKLDAEERARLFQSRPGAARQGRGRARHRRLHAGDPASTPRTRRPIYNRGLAYRARGDLDRALADFDQAIQHRRQERCRLLRARQCPPTRSATTTAPSPTSTGAINIKPDYTAAFNLRGLAYNAKGESDRAIADFDQALRIDPKFAAR